MNNIVDSLIIKAKTLVLANYTDLTARQVEEKACDYLLEATKKLTLEFFFHKVEEKILNNNANKSR